MIASMRISRRSLLATTALALGGFGLAAAAELAAQGPPRTVQPGAPGEATRVVEAADAPFTFPKHVDADVHFMQMMIAHHFQAIEMSALAPDRAEREDVKLLAHRIHLAQFDEIRLMANWLHDRGETVPPEAYEAGFAPAGHEGHAGHADHAGHGDHHAGHDDHAGHGAAAHDHHSMPGMLTPDQLAQLADSEGAEFDRLFLEFMIFHHEGAITMVGELFSSADGGQEGEVFQFASHVDSDQRIEIDRMRGMLARAPSTDLPGSIRLPEVPIPPS
ncbi:MAG: DUF305 domain-containing protein [Gemmatimonadales bacterium]|nr:MAG: DUF305 domain-containing protein [Gemmatimonadales bacterium]